jgi:hypothetical protein
MQTILIASVPNPDDGHFNGIEVMFPKSLEEVIREIRAWEEVAAIETECSHQYEFQPWTD